MKTKYNILFILLTTVILWSTGCNKMNRIEGNGQIITETRQLVSFIKVENDGTFNVYISHDSVFTAKVEAESNLIPHIRTRINGNTLEIDTRENLRNNYPINVYVTTPIISGASLNGSGSVTLDSLQTENMDVDLSGSGIMSGEITSAALTTRITGSGKIYLNAFTNSCNARISGSGDIELVGESLSGDFSISGSGNIRSTNFVQNECISKISGSGNMYLNVTDYLDVTISGSGSVYYVGNPQVNINITGSGSVIKQ
jgi:hypothetical protein